MSQGDLPFFSWVVVFVWLELTLSSPSVIVHHVERGQDVEYEESGGRTRVVTDLRRLRSRSERGAQPALSCRVRHATLSVE